MGLSRLLLIVAVAAALAPLVAGRLRPPRSIRDLEMSFVVATVVLGIGTFVVSRFHDIGLYLVAHLAYLIVVVTLPCLLIGWWMIAFVRRRRTLPVRLSGLGGVVLALLGVWGTHIEPNWLHTDVVAVAGPVGQTLRIGVLADVQTPNVGRHEWNAVETLIAQQPDIVLVPGDLFQGPADVVAANTPDFVELLTALVADVETVAVVSGDTDDAQQVRTTAEAAGALFVDNRIMDISVGGQPVRLVGVPVPGSDGRLDTIAALGTPSDALTILLSHRPDVVYELPLGTDVDLIVSGHTHGGQISVPFVGPLVTFSDVPRDVASGGLGVVDAYPVYVSTGVGLERHHAPQVRFGVRPSVGIIDVVPA